MQRIETFVTVGLMVILLITLGIVDTRRRDSEKELYKVKPTLDSISKQVDSLQKRCDSIEAESFTTDVMLNRYQVGFEIFSNRHPEYAYIFGDIISEETE